MQRERDERRGAVRWGVSLAAERSSTARDGGRARQTSWKEEGGKTGVGIASDVRIRSTGVGNSKWQSTRSKNSASKGLDCHRWWPGDRQRTDGDSGVYREQVARLPDVKGHLLVP